MQQLWDSYFYCLYFTGKETEAQKSEVSAPITQGGAEEMNQSTNTITNTGTQSSK